jgi:hypothetical protein
MTYILIKGFELFSDDDVDPNIRWKKYFSEGYTQENYCRYIDNIKVTDPPTYWLMMIAPNGLFITIALIIINLILSAGQS